MRSMTALLAATFLLAAPHAQAAPRGDGEARLARALEGRVAGEPVDCIPLSHIRSSQVIDDTAILYDVGSVVYVNRPEAGRESLNQWDALVVRPFGPRLCSIDSVRVYDTSARMVTGIVFLGEFVPYRRVRDER